MAWLLACEFTCYHSFISLRTRWRIEKAEALLLSDWDKQAASQERPQRHPVRRGRKGGGEGDKTAGVELNVSQHDCWFSFLSFFLNVFLILDCRTCKNLTGFMRVCEDRVIKILLDQTQTLYFVVST